ncbi:hypothetical protein [Butyrivibrio phage Arawn]|jgi:hypothetical protein|uniref:Uncharacterized protein n=1 Tax=Butyrivibrio phage Arawn TaxID=2724180 RepID=A0A6H1N0P3_9CAUD|nr:hypothetical protein HWD04_gp40 [Butyrivibrio phage Arawn]QIY92811.1 hypothetical protein [Butyrivibrio phage Arawn]
MAKNNNMVTADHIKIVLLKFKVELTDRRNGKNSKAEAIEIMGADFNVDAAQKKVEQKYAALGYDVYDIEVAGQRTYDTTALELYETLPDDELGKPVKGITSLFNSADSWRTAAEDAAREELKGDI